MDRRQAIGLGLAGALLPRTAFAQEHETGYLPGDSQEFIGLWPGTPPGGEGIHLDLKVADAVQPDGFHVRAVSQMVDQNVAYGIHTVLRYRNRGSVNRENRNPIDCRHAADLGKNRSLSGFHDVPPINCYGIGWLDSTRFTARLAHAQLRPVPDNG